MPKPSAPTEVDVEDVIEQVKKELANAASVAPHLRLTEFDLELSLTVKKSASVGLSFTIPLLGTIKVGPSGSAATTSTNKLALTFAPPTPKAGMRAAVTPTTGLQAALATIEKSINAGKISPPQLDLSV